MYSVDNYIGSIKANIEKQSDLLVVNLKKILSYNFSSDINLLDFSVFIEPTREGELKKFLVRKRNVFKIETFLGFSRVHFNFIMTLCQGCVPYRVSCHEKEDIN